MDTQNQTNSEKNCHGNNHCGGHCGRTTLWLMILLLLVGEIILFSLIISHRRSMNALMLMHQKSAACAEMMHKTEAACDTHEKSADVKPAATDHPAVKAIVQKVTGR